ncbi:hypothetical protein [Paraclostridium bifermentans]|uniref:hypothetical protein n=1 Tax=Paraclostridium bifermentans TaxID=1490 RepID=UPI0018999691|nr:hypothetical protein [Paraclostridium bifermentans]
MNFKKLSIIISMTLLIFSSSLNVNYALYNSRSISIDKEIVKDLEYIDNRMSLLITSISNKDFNKADVQKQVEHLHSVIDSLYKKASMLPKEEEKIYLAIQAILTFYELSILSTEDYLKSNKPESLVSAITYFSTGYYSLTSLRESIYKALK